MKYDKRDRAKIVALVAVLVIVWVFIGVRFLLISRANKAKERNRVEALAATRPQAAQSANATGAQGVSPTLRLATLVAPVSPPKSDPFRPVVAPRSQTIASRPTAGSSETPSTAVLELPPLPGASESSRGGDRLQLTGVIMGSPSTAVLRLGEDHFVVREGDVLNSTLRIQKITRTAVTLRDGQTVYTLRLGG